jgi:hypothetical protein
MKKPIAVERDWLFLLIRQIEKPAEGAFAVANPSRAKCILLASGDWLFY